MYRRVTRAKYIAEQGDRSRLGLTLTNNYFSQGGFAGAGRAPDDRSFPRRKGKIKIPEYDIAGIASGRYSVQFYQFLATIQFDIFLTSLNLNETYNNAACNSIILGDNNMKILPGKVLLVMALLIMASGTPVYSAEWKKISLPPDIGLTGIHLCSETDGFAVTARGEIVQFSTESKELKSGKIEPPLVLQDIFFSPGCMKGIMVGNKGTILLTEDGGNDWRHLATDSAWWFYRVGFIDSLRGFALGANMANSGSMRGVLLATNNGGSVWDTVSIDMGHQSKNMNISPDGVIVTLAADKIQISRDRGRNWEAVAIPPQKTVRSVALQGNFGLMAGMGGFAAVSKDGGKTWYSLEYFPPHMHFTDVLLIDSKRAFMVGDNGTILYTDDSGKNWVPELSGVSGELNRIVRVGGRIFACGQKGALVYSELAFGR